MSEQATVLSVSWGVSRGRDTYGYNICRLDDQATGKRYRCMGGGYDMVGTVFGDWLQDRYQDRLREISPEAYYVYNVENEGQELTTNRDGLYGMYRYEDGSVRLDGGCGLEAMRQIAIALGLELQRTHDRRGNTTGWVVTDARGES